MKLESLEIFLVILIIGIQFIVFFRTRNQIRIFRELVPTAEDVSLVRVYIPEDDLDRLHPKAILDNIDKYREKKPTPAKAGVQSLVKSLIHRNDNAMPVEKTVDNTALFSQGMQYALEDPEEDLTDEFVSFHEDEQEDQYEVAPEEIVYDDAVEVNILETNKNSSPGFKKILFSINNYLLRNRGASSDFNLIKDIVERNTVAAEEDINLSLGIPLYLGLMGTMIGIVIALFNMPDLGVQLGSQDTGKTLDEGIGMLIGGVKIAMIASFVGLLLTIVNSGWAFKGSKSFSETRKNDLYTFIQIELLPIINKGMASTLDSLQRNLMRFNEEFNKNLTGLSGIFDSMRSAIREQKDLLDALDRAKVSDMTRYNVAVLKQLDVSVKQFERFNEHITNVNRFVESSATLVSRSNEILDRTDNFREIADGIKDRLQESRMLMEFLSAHFNNLESHKDHTNQAVVDVALAITDVFSQLKRHIEAASQEMKTFTVDELQILKDAFSQPRNNLSNLEHLSVLKTDVAKWKDMAAQQADTVRKALDLMNGTMAQSKEILEKLESRSLAGRAKGLKDSVVRLFGTKKQA